MKTKILLSLFIITLISSMAFAQPPAPDPAAGDRRRYEPVPRDRREPAPRPRAGGPKGDIYRMCRNAGVYLTDEQIDEISRIFYEYELKISDLEYQKRNIDYKFKLEREKVDIDLNIIKDLINQKKDLEKEIDYLRVEKDVAVLDVLTDEQLAQLNSYRMRYYYYR
ncbi:Spy/CpxP family protein refolding chaperone [Brachyspira hampsonii]|uniref:Periplasmic heavy metal sensor n=1 Tax=Brachyspira hampsonii TaxID=1287055 RepID=A0AAC9XJ08_9SPIR|nr:hypothetical protein [Brachyspira hampsonii]ASJ20217.1 hypothetical protein BHAMNSH16_00520 [Brachyspira hampsonii]ELV06926.1 hypothetical protein H263_01280 [Brachyspira hampsonii 30599]MBW5410814.1 hypothetical protein [Brachyspira hampsonii]OEJ17044.1 hypothetical protein A9496_12100 [Brachyspira hampsonii]